MRAVAAALMSAATIVAALGLGGCRGEAPPAATSSPIVTTITSTPPPPAEALPPPEALTDVLYRLADTAVAGSAKLDLVEQAGPDDAEALDQFGRALADNGFAPLSFEARDLAWSNEDHGNVIAKVVVKRAANPPDAAGPGDFTFPMEFTPHGGGWQLSRHTADQLLELGAPESPTPESPTPASPSPESPAPASPSPTP